MLCARPLWLGGRVGVGVITRIKANLSSTELGLTSKLELSLAITNQGIIAQDSALKIVSFESAFCY